MDTLSIGIEFALGQMRNNGVSKQVLRNFVVNAVIQHNKQANPHKVKVRELNPYLEKWDLDPLGGNENDEISEGHLETFE